MWGSASRGSSTERGSVRHQRQNACFFTLFGSCSATVYPAQCLRWYWGHFLKQHSSCPFWKWLHRARNYVRWAVLVARDRTLRLPLEAMDFDENAWESQKRKHSPLSWFLGATVRKHCSGYAAVLCSKLLLQLQALGLLFSPQQGIFLAYYSMFYFLSLSLLLLLFWRRGETLFPTSNSHHPSIVVYIPALRNRIYLGCSDIKWGKKNFSLI